MSVRKDKEAERIAREQREARLGHLDQLIERLKSGRLGVTLAADEVMTALQVLEDLRAGYDPRLGLGIDAKPGPRPTPAVRDKLLAIYVMRLCLEQPGTGPKQHYATAATDTGYTVKRITNAVSDFRELATDLAHGTDLATVLAMLLNFEHFPGFGGEPGEKLLRKLLH